MSRKTKQKLENNDKECEGRIKGETSSHTRIIKCPMILISYATIELCELYSVLEAENIINKALAASRHSNYTSFCLFFF